MGVCVGRIHLQQTEEPSPRGFLVCVCLCVTQRKKKRWCELQTGQYRVTKYSLCMHVCVGTIQTYKRDLGLTVQYFGSFKKEQPCPQAVRCCSGQLGCMLACLTHAAHYQNCTEGSGQGCSARKYLWGLDLFFCFLFCFVFYFKHSAA